MGQALTGAAAPYLAEVIKQYAPDEASRIMAHAIVAGVVAAAQGNSAVAGAAGAATTALMGEAIKKALYGDVPVSQLSEDQKQTLVMLGSLAAGLAGGVAGGSTADAVAGAQAGQNELSNNMASMGLVQQMLAQQTLNSAAMAEAGKGGPNEQAALALTNAVKEGLDATCLQNPGCVLMAIVAAQQSQQHTESGGWTETLPIHEDQTGNTLVTPIPDENKGTTLVTPDKSDEQGVSHTGNTEGAPDLPTYYESGNKITQGEHATIRNQEGRPVGSVINDVQKSRPSDILVQDDGRWVVLGPKGRAHIIEADGEVVTSFDNSGKNTNGRIIKGEWQRASNDQLNEFKSKFSDYVRW